MHNYPDSREAHSTYTYCYRTHRVCWPRSCRPHDDVKDRFTDSRTIAKSYSIHKLDDPFSHTDAYPGQALFPHQKVEIDLAAWD